MHSNETHSHRKKIAKRTMFSGVSLPVRNIKEHPSRFLNRELSWLEFNKRVLQEAQNAKHPLLERLRFLSITYSNMDEFYMVRVAGLKTQLHEKIILRSIDGRSAQEQLDAIQNEADNLRNEAHKALEVLLADLKKEHIEILSPQALSPSEKKWLKTKYENDIFPVLTPLAVDPAHPFPFIANKQLALALRLHAGRGKSKKLLDALIPLPAALGRFIQLPDTEKQKYIAIEDVIKMHLASLFKPFKLVDDTLIRVIRDSELEIGEEADDIVRNFETALQRRRRGSIIHAVVQEDASAEILDFLSEHMPVSPNNIYKTNGFIGLVDMQQLITDNRPELLFPSFQERYPERIRDFNGDCFAAIQAKDIVIHHPYESFDVVVRFLEQAARDPDVVSIKQTLYRTSSDSPIVKALIEAAEDGKSVTAVVELKARFDEEANIRWAKDLERAGAQVVFGFVDYKTHAKMSLVARKQGGDIVQYAHFGTGNYHPKNAKIYTDLSFFTSDPVLCKDAAKTFNFMTGYAMPRDLEKLSISPLNTRNTIESLIDAEISNAQDKQPAAIWAKMNSLVDPEMIDKFYEASQAGVKVHLVVRGICCLRPGIKDLSENIEVRSIVGRFLEHSRIYAFANGKKLPSKQAKLFISSADIMTRNLDYRIETLVPIENITVHQQILDQIMVANLVDTTNSWALQYDGTYKRIEPSEQEPEFSAHEYFMLNPSLSGRGSAQESASMPPRLWFSKNS